MFQFNLEFGKNFKQRKMLQKNNNTTKNNKKQKSHYNLNEGSILFQKREMGIE